jgi:hypothetical protein
MNDRLGSKQSLKDYHVNGCFRAFTSRSLVAFQKS